MRLVRCIYDYVFLLAWLLILTSLLWVYTPSLALHCLKQLLCNSFTWVHNVSHLLISIYYTEIRLHASFTIESAWNNLILSLLLHSINHSEQQHFFSFCNSLFNAKQSVYVNLYQNQRHHLWTLYRSLQGKQLYFVF